jgi:penicillin-binding protein 1C
MIRRSRLLLSMLILFVTLLPLAGCARPPRPCDQVRAGSHLIDTVEAQMAALPGPSPKLFLTSRVVDRSGTPLGEYWHEGRRYWVALDEIAPPVRLATVATEDKTFYTNPGVDWSAIVRAVTQNQEQGAIVSGASTITQQLARNIALPYERRIERSLDRKLEETSLAQQLTSCFSKDEILEMYLNVVYYGHLAYGIEAAAQTYFAKPAADLTLAESALLAALPPAPALRDPLVPENRETAKTYQGVVLALMARNGVISAAEAEAAFAEPLNFRSQEIPALAPHALAAVQQELAATLGSAEAVGRAGLTITTTLDLRLQTRAEALVRQQVEASRERYQMDNAALVALQPGTGDILALVGGVDFYDPRAGQVNVAMQPRQPGSAIKPVLYAAAFARGYSPAHLLWDIPVEFPVGDGQVYQPVNYDGRFHGPVRLRAALANSYNVPAIELLDQVGLPALLHTARSMGITRWDESTAARYGLSLTLGGGEVSLLELTAAYSTLANQGIHTPPHLIGTMTDSAGRQVLPAAPVTATQAVDPRVAYLVSHVLSDNPARTAAFGPNSQLQLSRPAAAKTGTTTDFRDNWTVGYTPYLVTGVWAGNTDGSPMRNSSGLTGAAPIWHDFMEAVFADPQLDGITRPVGGALDFTRPSGLLDAPVCNLATLEGGPACQATLPELFIDPTSPVTIGVPITATALSPVVPITVEIALPPQASLGDGVIVLPAVALRDPAVVEAPVGWLPTGERCTGAGGTPALLLRAPSDPEQAVAVRRWAAEAGLPVEPPPCDGPALGAPVPGDSYAGMNASASLWSPQPGQVITGPVEIIGTALFDPAEFEFYKVEFGEGTAPGTWTTMGDVHRSPVSGGWLETWYAGALPPGPYALRVVIVRPDGNYYASPPLIVQIGS